MNYLLSRGALAVALFMGISFFIPGYPQAKAQGKDFNNIAPPDEKGPYDVGIRTIVNVQGSAGPLTVQVFYPTDPIDPTFDPTDCANRYTVQEAIMGVVGSYKRTSPLCAVENATVAAGEHPLIVYSHGGGGAGADFQRIGQLLVHETLASHGFVVVIIRHSANVLARVRDVPKVIDYMLADSGLSGSIDSERIGISGLSTGGRTSLVVAGGWADPPEPPGAVEPVPPIPADPRVKAMVLYEPGRDNTLDDVSKISIPYLLMGGDRIVNATVTIPEVFDATVLATPRIRVFNPGGLHMNYQTDFCPAIEETREASLPTQQVEPLTNMITLPSGLRACNIGQLGAAGPPPLVGVAALRACTHWNQGELVFTNPINFGFAGGRNFCNRTGVNSSQSLDTHPGDGFTDSFLGGDPLVPLYQPVDPPFISNESLQEPAIPAEVLVPMVKLYTVAFFKKFLEGDGRYMRYLTPGYASTQNLQANVEIRE